MPTERSDETRRLRASGAFPALEENKPAPPSFLRSHSRAPPLASCPDQRTSIADSETHHSRTENPHTGSPPSFFKTAGPSPLECPPAGGDALEACGSRAARHSFKCAGEGPGGRRQERGRGAREREELLPPLLVTHLSCAHTQKPWSSNRGRAASTRRWPSTCRYVGAR